MDFHTAEIVEIFSSLQGEGPLAGEPTTFVRFGKCTMRCQYCDTPQGLCHQESCQIESPPKSGNFRTVLNPVSASQLSDLIEPFGDTYLSITGGEPLEQAEFLSHWLPTQMHRRHILLETNGVHPEGLCLVLPYVHTISMDLKLPSSTGARPMWKEHGAFLAAAVASGRQMYVKVVVTAETSDRDLQEAIGILTRANKFIPIIIQPATPTLKFHTPPSEDRIKAVERLCQAYLADVRTIPQMHKQWGII